MCNGTTAFFASQTTHLLLLHRQLLLLQERQQLLCVKLLRHPGRLLLQLRHLCNSMVQASSLARRKRPAAVNGNSKATHSTECVGALVCIVWFEPGQCNASTGVAGRTSQGACVNTLLLWLAGNPQPLRRSH